MNKHLCVRSYKNDRALWKLRLYAGTKDYLSWKSLSVGKIQRWKWQKCIGRILEDIL